MNGNRRTFCDKSNVGYEGDCLVPKMPGRSVGETSRTTYTRVKEHMTNYRAASAAKLPPLQPSTDPMKRKDVKSWM